MKILLIILFAGALFIRSDDGKFNGENCSCKGKQLYGRVRIVDPHTIPDFRVRIVKNGEDLRVKVRPNEYAYMANKCGEWKFVASNESADFTVQFVEYSEDFTIRFVEY